MVTGGGLDRQGKWKETGRFLLPGRQIRTLYRGRFQSRIKEALEAGELVLPPDQSAHDVRRCYRQAYTKTWCVKIEPQYAHGKGVLLYLSRYLRGGPIHPSQIRRCDSGGISFIYKDHRDKRKKELTLAPGEFIRRLLQHVPESGQHMVRHYGLYAGACRKKRNACREDVGGIMEEVSKTGASTSAMAPICRACGHPLRLRWVERGKPRKANSYRVQVPTRHVQQEDEPVTAPAKKMSTPMRL